MIDCRRTHSIEVVVEIEKLTTLRKDTLATRSNDFSLCLRAFMKTGSYIGIDQCFTTTAPGSQVLPQKIKFINKLRLTEIIFVQKFKN